MWIVIRSSVPWITERRSSARVSAARSNERSRDHSVIQVQDPAVLALCDGLLPLGRRVRVRLATVDPDAARVRFVPAEDPPSRA